MTLLIGTDSGLYRADDVPFERDELDHVLDCGVVTAVKSWDHTEGVFVASSTGAYRSVDGGETWTDLEVPVGDRFWHAGQSEVWSILATADGALYAGTNDPYIFRSVDGGETWTEQKGFRELPSRGHWESPIDPHYARLRALETVPGRPDHLIAGVEAGGIHVSRDGGRTWSDHRDAIVDDVHQILPVSEDVWLVATGYLDHDLENLGLGHAVGEGGLWRTTDAGESFERIDTGNDFSYIRRVFVHDGRVIFCGGEEAPPAWVNDDHGVALFESTNFGRDFERVDFPGEPHEVIETWAVYDGDALCGSGLFDVPDERDDVEGRIMRRLPGEEDEGPTYETVGRVDANVSRIEVV
ncbi:BNR repeat-containing glycosyl hydrolase [Halorubrum distributum JCM 9100]|uniref:BNR repeat-containing glycosyl hydrolase n=2 Tax=Halorubrum distributum TaxID=29283 RepID=M0EB17_9EURY|nr:exo-alpha-sialidase [Halorubrum distributum]ELZ44960.1 BNR repeat-containing glycosyl hydrolase [Halorubrum distributum JCM 9100]ELZ51056.1 BNR repeat-containing glycosyl hydrolase [Halorubrum distributum JCM 10118]